MRRRLDQERDAVPPPKIGGPLTVGEFLTEKWLPRKRRQLRATTAYRYAWFVDRYIAPAIGDTALPRPGQQKTPPRKVGPDLRIQVGGGGRI